nr:retrovirus-related Pol polyprotein from transposon TNT 1-94 [Tanacetum cinerariifolium]
MMVQPQEDMSEDLEIPTDSHHTPTVTQPSTSFQSQQKQKSWKSKKRITEVPQLHESTHDVTDVHVTTTSNDPLLSGEDRLKLSELLELYTQLQSRVLALETAKANQALEIGSLKRKDAGLSDQEDASKQGMMIADLDADKEVALVDETHGRNDQDMFDTSIFDDEKVVTEEVVAEKEVSTVDPVPTDGSEKAEEGKSKRAAGEKLEQEDAKRQRIKEENESAKLKRCLEIIPEDDDDVTIKATPLSSKSLTIVYYKIYKEGRKIFFKIIRADDNIWKYQQGTTKVLNWKLFDSCGVYCFTTQNMVYYLLVEKMYPFTRNILRQIWNDVRLQVEYEVEMAYDLLRLIRRQINKGYRKIVRIKRLHDDLRVNAAQVYDTTVERLQLVEEFMLTEMRSMTYQKIDKDWLENKNTFEDKKHVCKPIRVPWCIKGDLRKAVKWILKYLRGTTNVGLVYGTNRGNHVDVTGFVDSDYAKDPDKGRGSIYGSYGVYEGSYLAKGTLGRVGVELNTMAVNCDNQGAIHLSRNHVFHERIKHINVYYHFIREVLEAKMVKVLKVGTEHNAVNALTKV